MVEPVDQSKLTDALRMFGSYTSERLLILAFDQADEILRLRAENARLALDAGRYQWLKEWHLSRVESEELDRALAHIAFSCNDAEDNLEQSLDQAIDAAISTNTANTKG